MTVELPGVFVTASHELSQEYREFERVSTVAANGFLADRKREVDVIVDRAIARGELAAGVDREIVFDLCVGAVFMRYLVMRLPLTKDYGRRLVDTVLVGYRQPDGGAGE